MTQQPKGPLDGAGDQPDAGQTKRGEPELPSFLKNPAPLDKALFVALMLMGVYSMALIAMRAFLLSHLLAYALMVGGYTSATISGAMRRGTGHVVGTSRHPRRGAGSSCPSTGLMGRRWGMEFIDMSLQAMPRAHRFFRKALTNEPGKTKAIILALPLGYAGPVPGTVLNAVAGLLKVGLGAVLALNVLSVLAINGLFMWLGWTFGDQVLDIVEVVNRYLLWITLGLPR